MKFFNHLIVVIIERLINVQRRPVLMAFGDLNPARDNLADFVGKAVTMLIDGRQHYGIVKEVVRNQEEPVGVILDHYPWVHYSERKVVFKDGIIIPMTGGQTFVSLPSDELGYVLKLLQHEFDCIGEFVQINGGDYGRLKDVTPSHFGLAPALAKLGDAYFWVQKMIYVPRGTTPKVVPVTYDHLERLVGDSKRQMEITRLREERELIELQKGRKNPREECDSTLPLPFPI